MADSIKYYVGIEATRSYLSPQLFLDPSHINVTVEGVEITQSDELTDTTFVVEEQAGSYYVTIGDSIILQNFTIIVQRNTPEEPLVVFENGSTIQARDLNVAYAQAVLIATEAKDLVEINLP